jgi:hypothetical protein
LIGRLTADSRPCDMILHAFAGPGVAAAQLTAIANVFYNEFLEQQGSFPTDYILDNIEVTDLNSATGAQITLGALVPGTGGAGLPNMCTVTELHSDLRGRSYNGRVHAPVPTANVDPATGELVGGVATAMNTFWGDINSELVALAIPSYLVVASRKLSTSRIVITVATRSSAGFIHRRKFG